MKLIFNIHKDGVDFNNVLLYSILELNIRIVQLINYRYFKI